MATKNYKYFLYSKTEHDMRTEVNKKIGKVFTPGRVFNKGKWLFYTEISSVPTNRHADTKVVAEGYIEDIKYNKPKSVWG